MPDSPSHLDRRAFCGCALAATALACGGGGGGGSGGGGTPPPPPNPDVATGQTKAALALNTPLPFNLGSGCAGAGFYLIKDAGGVYAVSATCTHLGGQPQISVGTQTGTAFKCSCHGSEFDLNGGNTLGPATSPLPHFQVREETAGGQLIVNTATTVSASTRI